jgi:hypothetical protein
MVPWEVDMTNLETSESAGTPAPDERRELARKRLQAKRDLKTHAVAYVVVNAFLVVVWAMSGGGFFWPVWVIAGWGIGLAMNVWEVYGRKPITEADVDDELRRSP